VIRGGGGWRITSSAGGACSGPSRHGVAVSRGVGPARQLDRTSSRSGGAKRAVRAGSRSSGWPAGGVGGCQGDADAHVGDRR
jgi:hypothetical protein